MSATITESDLHQFSGSESFYRHWIGGGKFIYTEGCEYLNKNGAGWLLDAIISHQLNAKLKTGDLAEYQLWELNVTGNKAVLTCKADTNEKPAVTQEIEFTDFPLPYIKLYLERGSIDGKTTKMILMLPSER